MAIERNYDYTVGPLLHDANRHRRRGYLSYCRCEDDHVIELRLVVAALNNVKKDTYTSKCWKSRLVDFFNAKHRNYMCLPH